MVIYAKMLDRGTFGMPIPGSKDVVTSSIEWEDLLKMVEGIMSASESLLTGIILQKFFYHMPFYRVIQKY